MAAWSGFTVIESREGWEIDSKPGSSLMAPLFYLLSSETCFRLLWQWHPALIAPSQVMSRNNSQHRKRERRVLLCCRMSVWDKVGSRWVRNCFLEWSLHSVGFWMCSLKHLGIEGMWAEYAASYPLPWAGVGQVPVGRIVPCLHLVVDSLLWWTLILVC